MFCTAVAAGEQFSRSQRHVCEFCPLKTVTKSNKRESSTNTNEIADYSGTNAYRPVNIFTITHTNANTDTQNNHVCFSNILLGLVQMRTSLQTCARGRGVSVSHLSDILREFVSLKT